jgi:metallo-beta-lactamase family protein
MEITFFGAARHVTGSCTMVRCAGTTILIDCGLPQGSDEKDSGMDFPFSPAQIDYVLLTHAHIDHSGRIPLLYKEGFRGTIYCTAATVDLCSIMLADSGHIQEMEAEWKSRKQVRAGKRPVEPLYTVDDATRSMDLFVGCDYDKVLDVAPGVRARFVDAGHLLGSSSIEVWLEEGGEKKKLVFSGDIGNFDQPIVKDPAYLDSADFVVMESTYGNRLHTKPEGAPEGSHNVPTEVRAKELAEIIRTTFARGGNVIIPSFAVGRTQEILYLIRTIIAHRLIPEIKDIPVFVDSPLSVKATNVFAGNVEGYYDDEAMELVRQGVNPILFPSLVTITDAEDSKALNFRKEPAVIISSSGMCEAGRIKHHLKHNLWRPECTVVFTGYQAGGTLGRSILDGARHVTIFGEQIDVRAEIRKLEGISGHADQDGLVRWLAAFKKKPEEVFIVHGEAEVATWFAGFIGKQLAVNAYAPSPMESFNLLGEVLPAAEPVPFTSAQTKVVQEAFALLEKGRADLDSVVKRMEDAAARLDPAADAHKVARLANAITRLASDLDFLGIKWGRDADDEISDLGENGKNVS